MSHLTDRQRKAIVPGALVAYNLSGGVALGIVKSIIDKGRCGHNASYHKWLIFVEPLPEWKSQASKKGVSKLDATFYMGGLSYIEPIVDKIVVLEGR